MSKTVVITEQGLRLGVKSGLLTIERQGREIARIKPHEVDQVVLMGTVEITSAAIKLLLRLGIDCIFMTRAGRYNGRLLGAFSKNIALRIAQFEKFSDEGFAVSLARQFVWGKISNQRSFLMRFQRELRDEHLGNVLARMRVIRDTLVNVNRLDKLRGYEGEAANLYFSNLGKCVKNPQFEFTGRNRRPPRDPINACLSLGYTLLGVVIESMVMEVGFDPYLGTLHEPAYGRPSLVLDLMEEFRTIVVDTLTFRLINRRQLAPGDFGPPEVAVETEDFGLEEGEMVVANTPGLENAVYLKGSGRKIFISSFFARLRERMYYPITDTRLELRQIIRQQVYQLARVLRGEAKEYVPFTVR